MFERREQWFAGRHTYYSRGIVTARDGNAGTVRAKLDMTYGLKP